MGWLARTAARSPGDPPDVDPTPPAAERRREEREGKDLAARLALLVKLVEGQGPELAAPILLRLDVAGLKRKRASADRNERLFAERALFALFVRASFYLPTELEAAGRPSRAALARAAAAAPGPPAPAPRPGA